MQKPESGFSLIELLVVVVVIGFMFAVLSVMLDPKAIISRVRDAITRSAMNRVVLSVEGFRSAYNKIPNEEDFFVALREGALEFEESCKILAGFEDNECLFLPSPGMLPFACDSSSWRSDGQVGTPCYIRYYSGPYLGGSYRLYAKSWSKEGEFFVYDSRDGMHLCPAEISDLYSLESCKKI